MVSRREWLRTTAGAGAALALGGFAACRPETGGAAAAPTDRAGSGSLHRSSPKKTSRT